MINRLKYPRRSVAPGGGMDNRLKYPVIVMAVVLLSGCGGALDMGALLGSLPNHLNCTLACAGCIQALHADGADDMPAASHVACAGHCAGCAASMVEDIAVVAGSADVDPEPIEPMDICPIDP